MEIFLVSRILRKWLPQSSRLSTDKGTQTMIAIQIRNFNLSHPKFAESSMNSLLVMVTCKNHFYKENLGKEKWALFRELYGPSKQISKFPRVNTRISVHKKIYFLGTSYRLGHYVIPNINLERFLCKKWAHCCILILAADKKRSRDDKIVINNQQLELCFAIKLVMSHRLLFSSNDKFDYILEKINIILKTNISKSELSRFFNKSGNLLTVLFDEFSDLGIKLDAIISINRLRDNSISINKKKLDDFFEPEKTTCL